MRRTRRFWVLGAMIALLLGMIPAYAGVQQGRVVSDDPVNWTPNVLDGRVYATAAVGDLTVVVGNFTRVQEVGATTSLPRQYIFAFDSSGQVSDTFKPVVDGNEIRDVVPAGDGTSVYIGGLFNNVNGVSRTGDVARLNVNTGAVDPQFRSAGFNRRVGNLALANGHLYVGGWFDRVAGQPHTAIAAVNPVTGAANGAFNLAFAGTWNGGQVHIEDFALTPDGDRMVAIGNFRTVNGQSRPQIAMIDTSGATAVLDSWATTRYSTTCHPNFETYMYEVDVSPDGEYFVAVTTGAYSGGPSSGTLCDTAARWDFGGTGPGQQPTWIEYSGGDTLTAVEVTDTAIYIGGHFRWMNNPFVGDQMGPGAVRRMGVAALDPRNGLPLSWNPSRERGWGVFQLRSSDQGLWMGHDTDTVNQELRSRLALFPLQGGATPPPDDTGSLPGNAYLLGQRPPATGPSPVLHRVNAGGPALASADGDQDWAQDTAAQPSALHNSGSNVAEWTDPIARTAAVPAGTPQEIFSTERWDPSSDPAMQWDFPAQTGLPLEVRVYLSNACTCTNQVGKRRFDVRIDGNLVLDDYDIVADVGDKTGTMKAFDIVSDGNVDLDFGHVIENPLVNGIEIVRTDIQPEPVDDDEVIEVALTEAGATSASPVDRGAIDWSRVRGAFMVDDWLYTGWDDGTFVRRLDQGDGFGRVRDVNLNGLTAFEAELPGVRAMWFDRESGRLYYTLGQDTLYYRYFTPESDIVGAMRFTAGDGGAEIDWRSAVGGFLANGRLYFSSNDGTLSSVQWNGGPVPGSRQPVSGPSTDGVDWRARALFLRTN